MKIILHIALCACAFAGCAAIPSAPTDPLLQAKLLQYRQHCVSATDGPRVIMGGRWFPPYATLQFYKLDGADEAAALEAGSIVHSGKADVFLDRSMLGGAGLAAAGAIFIFIAKPNITGQTSDPELNALGEAAGAQLLGIIVGGIGRLVQLSEAQRLGELAAIAYNRHLCDLMGLSFVPSPEVNGTNLP